VAGKKEGGFKRRRRGGHESYQGADIRQQRKDERLEKGKNSSLRCKQARSEGKKRNRVTGGDTG